MKFKRLGYKKAQIARKLNISRPTVIKYFEMSPEEYLKGLEEKKSRFKKTDALEVEVVKMLKKHPDFTSAQIFDRLHEKYSKLSFCESTLRAAIRGFRQKYEIPKAKHPREYEEVDELPMGLQMQVDFGVMKVQTDTGKKVKIYVIAFVMAHSRQKYCLWQSRPFTTLDTIIAHELAFEFYEGIPKEIVYDQDHLILVSENNGDLVFTSEFTKYRNVRTFDVFMCRKADPESKGKIENVVKYVKRNFALHRVFFNIDKWNEECVQWLERRGNGKMHETTRKIPSEVFKEEKKHLQPFGSKLIFERDNSVSYQVRKNNTVPIEGNRYSVPIGTYKGPDTYVNVEKTESEIIIRDIKTGDQLNRCNIFETKGNLFKNNNHKRDHSAKIDTLMDEILLLFSNCQSARRYLEKIRLDKPRYVRDQFTAIKNCIKGASPHVIHQTLEFCEKNKLYSAADFIDILHYYLENAKDKMSIEPIQYSFSINEDVSLKINIKPEIRDIDVYREILNKQIH
jgi:transposase